jgi:hypothetical protein
MSRGIGCQFWANLRISVNYCVPFCDSRLSIRVTEAETREGFGFVNGFFNKASTSIRLQNVESVELHQGFLGRLLDYGALKFNSTDKEITPVVKNPEWFKNILRERQDEIQG